MTSIFFSALVTLCFKGTICHAEVIECWKTTSRAQFPPDYFDSTHRTKQQWPSCQTSALHCVLAATGYFIYSCGTITRKQFIPVVYSLKRGIIDCVITDSVYLTLNSRVFFFSFHSSKKCLPAELKFCAFHLLSIQTFHKQCDHSSVCVLSMCLISILHLAHGGLRFLHSIPWMD